MRADCAYTRPLHTSKKEKMKKHLLIIGILIIQISAFGISEYEKGDSLFVLAKSGLSIRENSNTSSKTIGRIPYGEQIITQNQKTLFEYKFESKSIFDKENFKPTKKYKKGIELKGRWIRVKYKEKEGFIFDGYLSKFKPPKLERETNLFFLDYFENNYKISKEIKRRNKNVDGGQDRILFKNGIYFRGDSSTGWSNIKIVFPEASLEEIYLLIVRLNPYSLSIKQTDDSTIEFIDDTGGITIKNVNGSVTVSGYWSC